MGASSWIRTMLDHRGLTYAPLRHRAAWTALQLAARERASGRVVAKVVVAMVNGRPVQLVLPADRRVSLLKLGEALQARTVRLAREDELAAIFVDCELGAEPPLRHWAGVDVWMDPSLQTDGEIVFQGGTHRDAIRMRFSDWFRLVEPRVGAFAL